MTALCYTLNKSLLHYITEHNSLNHAKGLAICRHVNLQSITSYWFVILHHFCWSIENNTLICLCEVNFS